MECEVTVVQFLTEMQQRFFEIFGEGSVKNLL